MKYFIIMLLVAPAAVLARIAEVKPGVENKSTALSSECEIDFSTEYKCSSVPVVFYAQSTAQELLEDSCDLLKDVDDRFHNKLDTNREPVPNDRNDKVEVYVFENRSAYTSHARDCFEISSSGGVGLYVERDPSNADLLPFILVYEFKVNSTPPALLYAV